ncbi:MAG: DUF4499 domain-containing protein [Gammaproteobacteria bacterium]
MQGPIAHPHPGWWIAIIGGMSLTGWIAFSATGYQLWSEGLTAHLPQGIFQWIFWLASAVHLLEAMYAYRLAQRSSIGHAGAWALQTLVLGYASLHLLRRATAR